MYPHLCPVKTPKSHVVSWGKEPHWWISTLSCREGIKVPKWTILIRSCFVHRCCHCRCNCLPFPSIFSTPVSLLSVSVCFSCVASCLLFLLCTKTSVPWLHHMKWPRLGVFAVSIQHVVCFILFIYLPHDGLIFSCLLKPTSSASSPRSLAWSCLKKRMYRMVEPSTMGHLNGDMPVFSPLGEFLRSLQ